jgi:hypothetical protein
LNFQAKVLRSKDKITKLNISSRFYYQETLDMKDNRQKINLPLDEILLELQSKELETDFLKFCFLNRDNLSYSLLYQITALKLKGEEKEAENIRSNKIKELRKKILEHIQLIDQPITQSLIVSEKTVKELLTQDDSISNLDKIIKKNRIDVSSLWIVLTAAISAWENKLKFEEDDNAKTTLKKLKKIKKTVFSDDLVNAFVAKELIFIDSFLFSGTKETAPDLVVENLDGIKLLICILEKLPKSSYGILLAEVSYFYNNLLKSKLGLKKMSLTDTAIQFSPRQINTDSRLAKIKDLNLKN